MNRSHVLLSYSRLLDPEPAYELQYPFRPRALGFTGFRVPLTPPPPRLLYRALAALVPYTVGTWGVRVLYCWDALTEVMRAREQSSDANDICEELCRKDGGRRS